MFVSSGFYAHFFFYLLNQKQKELSIFLK